MVHEDPTRAVVAIDAMGRYGAAFAANAARLQRPSVPSVRLPAATPSEAEAKRLLAEAGIASAPEAACATAGAGRGGGGTVWFSGGDEDPVARHRPQVRNRRRAAGRCRRRRGPFRLRTVAAAGQRAAAPAARIEGVLVAKQLKGGVECILGIHRDPVFGPMAMFGLGGIFVEVMKDVVFRRCPFGPDVAEAMIRSIKGAPLLLGARGRKPADVKALAEMLSRLSAFAVAAGERLQSIDLNPVFAMPEGRGRLRG